MSILVPRWYRLLNLPSRAEYPGKHGFNKIIPIKNPRRAACYPPGDRSTLPFGLRRRGTSRTLNGYRDCSRFIGATSNSYPTVSQTH